jgi:tetratricopeptide (TPR) repeat protein
MSAPLHTEKTIFLEAAEIASPTERAAFLERSCGDDRQLRAAVEALLLSHQQSQGVLDGTSAPLAEHPGTIIGPYKLLEQIGEGGMGTVFMAEQTHPVQRKVALKVIKPGMDSHQVIARFEAERQALAMMDHVNIARVLDAGATGAGRPYFVMELVHGVPITKYCDDNHLTPRERLELFVPVCQAIQHAHQKGIIHRDIKPTNVMITLYDGKPVPKVIDFGVAKATEQKLTERSLFTQYGTMVGTLEYMSPEQAEMSALGVDTRSDIYSLGVLLYELLTGSTPLTHKRIKEAAYAEIFRMIKEEEPPKPTTRLSDSGEALASISARRQMEPAKLSKLLRGELDWIVMKTLEKDRNRRYETANGFAADVQRYLNDEPVQACPASAGYRFRKFARRNKRALITMTLLGVMLLVAVGAVAGSLGWVSRGQAARRLVVEQAAGRALAEGDQLQKQGKWQEALVAVERSRAALASGEGGAELQRQVGDQLVDLHMIQRLEGIRTQRGEDWDNKSANRAYARAFADIGIEMQTLSLEEAAARIRSRPVAFVRIAAALDDWAQVLRDQKHDPAIWKRLLEVARLADPDPWRGQLRQLLGREDLKALRQLAESSDIAALPVQSLQLMGNALVFGGDSQACVAWLRKAQRQNPGDVLINFDLAYHLSTLPSAPWGDVLRFYQAALAARPHSSSLYSAVGDALHSLGRPEEEIASYQRALELNPRDARAYTNFGNACARIGQHNEAIAAYEKAIALDPKSAPAHVSLGSALWFLGRHDDAIATYRRAIELEPEHAQAHNGLGWALQQKGALDEAIPAYREAIRLMPDFAEAHVNLGVALTAECRLDAAIAAFEKAITFDPKSAPAYTRLGIALSSKGRLDDAIVALRKAIELKPDYALAHSNYGNALKAAGRLEEAIGVYKQALPLLPTSAQRHNDLAWLLATGPDPKFRDPKRAVELAQKAVELAPKEGSLWNTWGIACYRAGEWKDGIDALKKSDELLKGEAFAFNAFFLAMANWQLGHKDEARTWYDRSIAWMEKNQPKNEELLRFRAEAEQLLGITLPNPTPNDAPPGDEAAKPKS